MGFFSKLLGAAVDVVATPVEIVRDAVDIATGDDTGEESHTMKRLKKASDKLENAADDLSNGDVL